MLRRLDVMVKVGWTAAYTDGSVKQVGGWWQAGYGVFFSQGSPRNYETSVPQEERQSVRRGELHGILHALRVRQPHERMVIVLNSGYVQRDHGVVPEVEKAQLVHIIGGHHKAL